MRTYPPPPPATHLLGHPCLSFPFSCSSVVVLACFVWCLRGMCLCIIAHLPHSHSLALFDIRLSALLLCVGVAVVCVFISYVATIQPCPSSIPLCQARQAKAGLHQIFDRCSSTHSPSTGPVSPSLHLHPRVRVCVCVCPPPPPTHVPPNRFMKSDNGRGEACVTHTHTLSRRNK